MVINFSLLGKFAAQVGNGPWKALGEDRAAQILAYLVYKGRFCPRDEIIRELWGEDRLPGNTDELSADGLKKQLYLVRDIFTNDLKVDWQEYVDFHATGVQLQEGMIGTDLESFTDLAATGSDNSLSVEERLEAFQRADRLRRGFFLQGMHAPWINSINGGARRQMSEQVLRMHKTIVDLQIEQDKAWGNRVAYCDNIYQAIPVLRKSISEARHEVIFQGTDLRVVFPMMSDLLPSCVGTGVRIKFALLNPEGQSASAMAQIVRDDEANLREECRITLRRLKSLVDDCRLNGIDCTVEITPQDQPITAQSVAIDPQHAGGQLFLFPFVTGIVPSRLPGYIWPHRTKGPYAVLNV